MHGLTRVALAVLRTLAVGSLAVSETAAVGCARVQVTVEAEPGAQIERFETYALADPPRTMPEIAAHVAGEIDAALAAKGYRRAPEDAADMLVSYRGSEASRTKIVDAADPDTNYKVVEDYVEGVLVVEVVERSTQRVLWHGVGQIDIVSEGNFEKAAAYTAKSVLKAFPSASTAGP